MATESERLELTNPRTSVFVTQLNQNDDDTNSHCVPVIRSNADKLLVESRDTLQKTLLLRKQVSKGNLNKDLAEKYEEFRCRMELCSVRRKELQLKQDEMKERVDKFVKFAKENDMKRRSAIKIFQREFREREEKAIEFSSLRELLKQLRRRRLQLLALLTAHKKFEIYLLRVVDHLPPNYLQDTHSPVHSLISRYQALRDTNSMLTGNRQEMFDEIESLKRQLDRWSSDHVQTKVSIGSQLTQLQVRYEAIYDHNERLALIYNDDKLQLTSKLIEFSTTVSAINNLSGKCSGSNTSDGADTDNLVSKLNSIQDYMSNGMHLVRTVTSEPDD